MPWVAAYGPQRPRSPDQGLILIFLQRGKTLPALACLRNWVSFVISDIKPHS